MLLPLANEVWGKVIFSEAGVKNSVHSGVGWWVVSHHALQISRPTPKGEVEGSGLGGSPVPHPMGKLRGLAWGDWVSRPTPWGVSRSTPRGSPGPDLGAITQHALRQTPYPADGYCCGQYASYLNGFLFGIQVKRFLAKCFPI